MGFIDKAKAMGTDLAAKAQDGMSQGQTKLSEVQANKRAAGLLEQLGAWQWAQQHGRDRGRADDQLARVIAELDAHEQAHGEIAPPLVPVFADAPLPPPPAGAAPPPPSATAPPDTPPPPSATAPPAPPDAPPPPSAATTAPAPPTVPEGGFTLD